jgi:hypothetical protein
MGKIKVTILNSGNIGTGGTAGLKEWSDASFNNVDISGTLNVHTFNKTLENINTTYSNTIINDNIITLGLDASNSTIEYDTGIIFANNKKDASNVTLYWDPSDNAFIFAKTDSSGVAFHNDSLKVNRGEYSDLHIKDLSANDVNIKGTLKVKGVEVGGDTPVNNSNQTFFQILTQQPHKFQMHNTTNQSAPTSGFIDISWNYDNILAKEATSIARLSFKPNSHSSNQSLPFINKIKIDISGSATSNNWESYRTISIGTSVDYNDGDTYKKETINKNQPAPSNVGNVTNQLKLTDPFDLRIYGENYASENPSIDNRALIYRNLAFVTAAVPSTPIFVSALAAFSQTSIKFKYKVDVVSNSAAHIVQYDASFNEVDTTAYNTSPSTATQKQQNCIFTPTSAGANVDTTITLAPVGGLKPGTKYSYQVKAKNNLSSNFSNYSTPSKEHATFTRLPGSNGFLTTIDNDISNNSKTNIISKTGVVNNAIYINIGSGASGKNIIPNESTTQTFEITKPYEDGQEATNTGYGKFVDGLTDLVTLKVMVDGESKQDISFNGFGKTIGGGGDTTFIGNISQSDIYPSGNNKNFRLKGGFQLNTIANNVVASKIGAARDLPHTLQYKYERNISLVNGSNNETEHNIYVDNLTGDPVIEDISSNIEVTEVKYNMGIASVKTMNVTIKRKYTNCNSVNRFIVGGGKVGEIGTINESLFGGYTTNFSSQTKNISFNNIDIDGSYYHIVKQNNIYYNDTSGVVVSTSSIPTGIVNTLIETSNAYNLVNVDGHNQTNTFRSVKLLNDPGVNFENAKILNHFYDGPSYEGYNPTDGSRLNLTTAGIREITNISHLSQLSKLTSSPYTFHNNPVKDWTLLYIGGKFQGNSDFLYPDTKNGINYDNMVLDISYNAGNKSYTLENADGDPTDTGSGYKWIVFDLKKNGTDKYSLYGMDLSIQRSGDIDYIDIGGLVSVGGLFSANIFDALFSSTDMSGVCFVKATKNNASSTPVMATPQGSHNAFSPWYSVGSVDEATKWSDLAGDSKYYCKVGDTGISINPPTLNDDLKLFIGVWQNN